MIELRVAKKIKKKNSFCKLRLDNEQKIVFMDTEKTFLNAL